MFAVPILLVNLPTKPHMHLCVSACVCAQINVEEEGNWDGDVVAVHTNIHIIYLNWYLCAPIELPTAK